jgi:signal transduction histidine kinase
MMEPNNAASPSMRERELDVAREVAHAFVTASSPVEVYRLALARLTPLVRASFSSVFQRDPADPTLLKLACANSWPQSSARFLGQLRVREGRGPTGRAVAEGKPVEVSDVFADLTLREWWEPARELGFVSLISLPLQLAGESTGALTFYFATAREFDDDERHLLMLIADQLALAGGRAEAQDAQRRELERLRAENAALRVRVRDGEDARRLKDEFVSNVSHELLTPLTAILGYASLLLAEQAGALPAEQRTAVARIENSANVLVRLITDLLELSQLKLGRTPVEAAPDDALLIAQRALAAVGQPPGDVQVLLEEPAQRLQMMVDGEKVVKVLENLLSNAYKFTPRGTVTLTVRQGPDDGGPTVEWIVADTGIGIGRDEQDAIFDEFRQVDGSSTRLYGGTGLGLALSRGLARLLGGQVTVHSEPGRGARFHLWIPQY